MAQNTRAIFTASLFFISTLFPGPALLTAEPLGVVYTAINLMYGSLWVTQVADIFKKYNLDTELLCISGGTLAAAAMVSGDMQIAFTGAANIVSANLNGADVILLGAV